MGRGKLTTEEIIILSQNPNVYKVEDNRIIYTDAFKKHFMEEYFAGKGPTTIFREAGFDTKVLGTKRIETATARWKEAYQADALGVYQDGVVRQKKRQSEMQEELKALKAENKLLKKQLQLLRTILGES